jgi:hypothetical protein
MKNFDIWLIERALYECNVFLNEALIKRDLFEKPKIPELVLKQGIPVDSIVDVLLQHYRKEVSIQSRYGGIRRPASVLVNKIRHEMTNYDTVRDAITKYRKEGLLSNCEEINIRIGLVGKVFNFVDAVISNIKGNINVPGQSTVVKKEELIDSNRFYSNKEMDELQVQRRSYRC